MAKRTKHENNEKVDSSSLQEGGDEAVLTPADLQKIAEEISGHFTLNRAGTNISLMDVDPHRVHAYWNVTPEDRTAAEKEAGKAAQQVVRVYESGTPAEAGTQGRVFDIPVQGLQGNINVDTWQDAQAWFVELGLRKEAGGFYPLARSEAVHTPRQESQIATLGGVTNGDVATVPDGDTPPLPENKRIGLEPFFPIFEMQSQQFKSEPVETENDESDASGTPQKKLVEEKHFPSPESLGSKVANNSDKVDECYEKWGAGESAITEMQAESGHQASASEPASGAKPPDAPAEDLGHSGVLPLESYASLSSSENGKRDPLLEINAELHIYGRAQPNTELTLYGQKVPVRPDGTFSIRRLLPHGALVLPLLFSKE